MCKHGLTPQTCHYCRGGSVTFHNPTGTGAVHRLPHTAIVAGYKENRGPTYYLPNGKNVIEDDLISKIDYTRVGRHRGNQN